jgi:hypothetical protein
MAQFPLAVAMRSRGDDQLPSVSVSFLYMQACLEASSSLELSSSEADSRSAAQEMSNVLWNPKVQYRAHEKLAAGSVPEACQFRVRLPLPSVKILHGIFISHACYLFFPSHFT